MLIALYWLSKDKAFNFWVVKQQVIQDKEGSMSQQQSQKRGVRSEAQKEMRAREGYDPIPPSNPVAGAFGEDKRDTPTDQDLALSLEEKRARRRRTEDEGE